MQRRSSFKINLIEMSKRCGRFDDAKIVHLLVVVMKIEFAVQFDVQFQLN